MLLGRRVSTSRTERSARQRGWPAQFSERQVGLWLRSFGCDQALGLQGLPSPLLTLQYYGSALWFAMWLLAHPPGRWVPTQAMHGVAYPQLRCVWPKRWQRLYCSGPFRALYDSTDTRNTLSSVSDCTLYNSGLRATDMAKSGLQGGPWRGPGL